MNRQEYEQECTNSNSWLRNIIACKKYIASLESEVESLKAENATLREDNATLIEQVNACGIKYEKELKMSSELTDKVESLLGNCLYHCNRVWEAWQYGTMTEDDFILAKEDSDIVNDFVAFVNDEVKSVEDALRAELEKTQKALELACYAIGEVSCPYKHDICKTPAESLVNRCVDCWKKYFLKKAGE